MQTKVLLFTMMMASVAAMGQTNTPVKVRVVQCWDDSLTTDIPLVALLKKHRAKATFNIIPRETPRASFVVKKMKPGKHVLFSFLKKEDSREGGFTVEHLTNREMPGIYKGFTIAAHCGIPLGDTPKESEARMRTLLKTKAQIRDDFGQEVCGYVYPGGGFSPAAMVDIRKAGYLYARTTKSARAPLPLDEPMALPASCHWSAANFWERYDEAKKSGGIFYFWGHSCEMGDDPELWAWLESIYERISADPEAEWADVIDLFAEKAAPAAK
jgi:peptidoglycan/xylan/chitin deacetylase (PgdA/CDA1 family)